MYVRSTVEGNSASNTKKNEKTAVPTTLGGSNIALTPQKSYWKKLQLFVKLPGHPSLKQLGTMMYRPLGVMYHFPSISWAGFVYGTCLSWYNALNATASSVLTAAYYNFSSGLVGTAYLSPVIGAGLGVLWSGWPADKLAIRFAHRHNGVREPEQKLWTLGFSGLLCATVSYSGNCWREYGTIIMIDNTMGFAVSYGIIPWIDSIDLQNYFITVAIVSLACTFTFVPMIFVGKKLRRILARKYSEYVAANVAPNQ